MRRHHHHLTDQDLLLAIDQELPSRRQADAESHLGSCTQCQIRRAQVDRAADLVTAVYHSEVEADLTGGDELRERLRLKLGLAARECDPSWRLSVLSQVKRTPRWLRISAALIATIVLARTVPPVQPQEIPDALVERDALPIRSLTPGAVWSVSREDICDGRQRQQRPVPAAIRQEVLRVYDMQRVASAEYELDYLITPELGGAADTRNLWPQRYRSRVWNALVKDQLEHLLPQLVCQGVMELATAQREISGDWVAAYQRHFKTNLPIETHAGTATEQRNDEWDDNLSYPVWRPDTSATLTLISISPTR